MTNARDRRRSVFAVAVVAVASFLFDGASSAQTFGAQTPPVESVPDIAGIRVEGDAEPCGACTSIVLTPTDDAPRAAVVNRFVAGLRQDGWSLTESDETGQPVVTATSPDGVVAEVSWISTPSTPSARTYHPSSPSSARVVLRWTSDDHASPLAIQRRRNPGRTWLLGVSALAASALGVAGILWATRRRRAQGPPAREASVGTPDTGSADTDWAMWTPAANDTPSADAPRGSSVTPAVDPERPGTVEPDPWAPD